MPACSTTSAGQVTTWPHWPRRCARTTSSLDIGTGSGVLAVAAARAGARRVYAVEASDIAEVAARVFEVNGVKDRVTLLPGWSRQIELPEPADLLVAEVIGNEPLEEEILETTLDARQRLLKPGARMIPHTLTLFARAVVLPESECRQRTFGRAAVERWRGLYDIDFQPLLDAANPGPLHTVTEGEVVATWQQVGSPAVLASLDLTSFEEPSVRACADLVVAPPGAVNAIAITFRADLHEGISHTLDPWSWPASSWATSVWVLPDPVEVGPGCRLRVGYHRRVAGVPDGVTCEVVERGTGRPAACRIGIVGTVTLVHNRSLPRAPRLEPTMGVVRRRTRRRTMMVAGGLAYERGRNAGQAEAYAAARVRRAAASAARAAGASAGRGRCRERDRALGIAARLRRASEEEFAAAKKNILGI